jgi:CRISPR-associated protein Cmr1
MKTVTYRLTFLTPAFLGDAEQSGRWRTPPIKALLRQWWRVVYAADHDYSVDEKAMQAMRREEGLLFGNAWLDNDFRKSLVRLRLDRWERGKLTSWNGLEQPPVAHPEVERTGYKVGPHAYLGYGPLDGRGGTKLNEQVKAVVNVGEGATLSLAMPDEAAPRIQLALWLMDRYGTLGGRSRNGWGSFTLTPDNGTMQLDGQPPLRDWKECLETDWPHAIGKDDHGALIWQTAKTYDDWKTLMRDLAIIKIGLRTQFVFPPNVAPPHPQPLERHWLSYPITRHTTRAFDHTARLPNSLCFKVRRAPEDRTKLVGVIVHVPCLPPPAFNPDRAAIERTWQTVHGLLDELCKPANGRSYSSIKDEARRQRLKPSLDTVTLIRIPE